MNDQIIVLSDCVPSFAQSRRKLTGLPSLPRPHRTSSATRSRLATRLSHNKCRTAATRERFGAEDPVAPLNSRISRRKRIDATFTKLMRIAEDVEDEERRARSCLRHHSHNVSKYLVPKPDQSEIAAAEPKEEYATQASDPIQLAPRQAKRLRPLRTDEMMARMARGLTTLELQDAKILKRSLLLSSMKQTFLCSTFNRFSRVLNVFND
ncbi:MAG: hypothetical protein P4M11_14500 [Candidatus Pacebacteria bacterium]|nr:hypothetical protein [Candidatus Paceibacterota bacterium]